MKPAITVYGFSAASQGHICTKLFDDPELRESALSDFMMSEGFLPQSEKPFNPLVMGAAFSDMVDYDLTFFQQELTLGKKTIDKLIGWLRRAMVQNITT